MNPTDITWVQNPLSNEMFLHLGLRALIVLAASAVLMVAFNMKNLAGLFQTTIWRKFVVWAVMGPAILIIVYTGFLSFLGLVGFIMFHATAEYLKLWKPPLYYHVVLWVGNAGSLIFAALAPEHVLVLPLILLILTMVAVVARDRVEREVANFGSLLVGVLWLGVTLSLFAALHTERSGCHAIVVVIGVVCLSDVFAVFFGKAAKVTGFGKSPLAKRVSPNKTRAGVVGNIVGATLAFLAYDGAELFGWFIGLGLAFVIGLLASVGDLLESLLKRSAGVKDSGTLIPYHGGMLDRIDSLLPTVVVFWIALQAVERISG